METLDLPLVCGMVVCFAAAGLWDLLAGRIPNRWLAFWYTAGFVYFACSSWLAAAGYLVRSAATVGLFFLLFLCRMMGAADIKCMALLCAYLGFGAGLADFMFCGFVKSIPLEIEEAAMIDGCTPLRTFFNVVLPIMKPTYISVGILETMWIWNDCLLPYLVLDLNKYKTISIAIQYMKGSYGRVDMGAIMAALILAVIPVVIFYLACQNPTINGVAAGAVKG